MNEVHYNSTHIQVPRSTRIWFEKYTKIILKKYNNLVSTLRVSPTDSQNALKLVYNAT
jgi:hypothetical protein